MKFNNIFSAFDGISTLQIALGMSNIKYDNYYASEIDKYAIKIAMANYPNTIQLGDICEINGSDLPEIDLFVGGSPCQNLSVAGDGTGLEGKKSRLFYEYVRLLEEIKPKYFLLENVASMKKKWQDVITGILGVEPVPINSRRVTAQNRARLYWTNIPNVTPPADMGILLKDILEYDGDCVGAIRGRYIKVGEKQTAQKLELRHDCKSNAITTVQKDNVVCKRIGTATDIKGHDYNKRIYSIEGKSPTLSARGDLSRGTKIAIHYSYRILTPVECERLQSIPDNYTNYVSNTQRYKAIGNSFTPRVISHILNFIKE